MPRRTGHSLILFGLTNIYCIVISFNWNDLSNMKMNRVCSFEIKDLCYKCHRPAWKDDNYCLFHSEQYDLKREDFVKEIKAIKSSNSSLHRKYEREGFKNSDFLGFKFPENTARFVGYVFTEDLNFDYSIINGDLDLNYIAIKGDLTISNSFISGNLNLKQAEIEGLLLLNKCLSIAEINLTTAHVNKHIFISKIHNLGKLIMDDLLVNGNFSFLEISTTGMSGDFSAKDELIMANITFKDTTGKGYADINYSTIKAIKLVNTDFGRISFVGTHIEYASIEDPHFVEPDKNSWWLWDSLLLGRPNKAIYNELRSRDIVNFGPDTTYKEAESVYLKLKTLSQNNNDKQLARLFRAGQLNMKMLQRKNLFEVIALFLYQFISGYGLRWVRALIFWLVCVFSFATFAYWGQEAAYKEYNSDLKVFEYQKDEELDYLEALRHSVETSTVILQPHLLIENETTDLYEGLQRLLSPLLLLFFLQAAKHRLSD